MKHETNVSKNQYFRIRFDEEANKNIEKSNKNDCEWPHSK